MHIPNNVEQGRARIAHLRKVIARDATDDQLALRTPPEVELQALSEHMDAKYPGWKEPPPPPDYPPTLKGCKRAAARIHNPPTETPQIKPVELSLSQRFMCRSRDPRKREATSWLFLLVHFQKHSWCLQRNSERIIRAVFDRFAKQPWVSLPASLAQIFADVEVVSLQIVV